MTKRSMVRASAFTSVLFMGAISQQANAIVWSGAGGDSNWGNSNNWVGGVVPNGVGVVASFGELATARAVTINDNFTVGSLIVGESTGTGTITAYTFANAAGKTLTLQNTGTNAATLQQIARSPEITFPALVLASNLDITSVSNQMRVNAFTGTGGITLTSSNTQRINFQQSNTSNGDVTISRGTLLTNANANGVFGSVPASGMRNIFLSSISAGTQTTLQLTGNAVLTLGSDRVLNIGTNGGEINATGGRIVLNTSGQLVGSTTLRIFGGSGTASSEINAANPGYTGTFVIGNTAAGTNMTVDLTAVDALGGHILVNTTGILRPVTGALAAGKSITLASGTLNTGGTSGTSAFTLSSGQTIAGVGTLTSGTGGSTVNGILSVGTSHGTIGTAGTITGTGPVTLGGEARFDLFTAAANGSSDKFGLTGLLSYGGLLRVANPTGANLAVGNSWDLFDGTYVAGTTFDNTFGTAGDGVYLPTLAAGTWAFDYTSGTLSVVPEPAGLAAASVVAGLLIRRRRTA